LTAHTGPLLGCVADDLTGAADLATRFRQAGFRVHLRAQVPRAVAAPAVDVLIVGLKSRMKPVRAAVAESLTSLEWLAGQGCEQFYLKYASTFDCTQHGNIGPVIDAAMSQLGVNFTVACPALPSAGRTTLRGRHLVDGVPLSESYMRHHPLTPMKNSHLVPVLQAQTVHHVGLIPHSTVGRGASAILDDLKHLWSTGYGIALIDAVTDGDLRGIGAACARAKLTTGSSGLALALLEDRQPAESSSRSPYFDSFQTREPLRAVISGSCSEVTQRQVAIAAQEYPAVQIDPANLAAGNRVVDDTLRWASQHLRAGPILIYSTADPTTVKKAHGQLGARHAASLVETALASIADGLVRQGVGQLIIAGGETSGAVAEKLEVRSLQLGATIDSGISWTLARPDFIGGKAIALAFKPGNFGDGYFFVRAWNALAPRTS
jgi:uncharacterized protein YgbK (DUF1537 family)